MSKSTVVIDTPKTCGDCPFCIYTAEEKKRIGYCNTSDEDYYCKVLDRFMEYDVVDGGIDILGKPSDCPCSFFKPSGDTHILKCLPQYFNEVKDRKKSFELRRDDRDYKVGDKIILKEWDGEEYTGREILNIKIQYILRDCPEYGLKEGYCILGF